MHVNDVVNKKKWKGNKIMERICILAFLGINSWKDIRTREVSLLSIVVFGIMGMIRACFLGTVSVDLVWNVCMGAAVIMLSIISKGAVGMGDGLLFLSLGTVLSFEELCQHFYWDFFAAVFGGLWCYFCQEKGKRLRCLSFHFLCWDTLEV